jgi:AraC family transcriptional regulator, regulatory protein of adaptative response / DNA-3-methyladenine glycosylase II
MLPADHLKLYKSMRARDPRSDGRFYVGVKTTGIYCRPVCPAKPKIQNVNFYKSKAEAENAGFRPCLRCRPDLSPLSPQWGGAAAVIPRALRLIENNVALNSVAEKLGLSERHLRRLFHEHVGASPVEVLISTRLHLARQLLSQTSLSVLDIAEASGFGSLRRFNEAFSNTYKKSPRDFRQELKFEKKPEGALKLELHYSPPYDWNHILTFFKRHKVAGCELVNEKSYSRVFKTSTGVHYFTIQPSVKPNTLDLKLSASLAELRSHIEIIKRQFDLSHNPHHVDFKFKEIQKVRVPGCFSAFETAVTIVLGQLVSTEQAQKNVKKLVQQYGEVLEKPAQEGLTHLFPTAQTLQVASFENMGVTRARAHAIRELARMHLSGELNLSSTCDLAETRQTLLSIKGIGPWTVEMIALRCLNDTDAFPAKDLIVARALEKFKIKAEECSPWRAYLALAIWKTQAHLLSHKKKEILK